MRQIPRVAHAEARSEATGRRIGEVPNALQAPRIAALTSGCTEWPSTKKARIAACARTHVVASHASRTDTKASASNLPLASVIETFTVEAVSSVTCPTASNRGGCCRFSLSTARTSSRPRLRDRMRASGYSKRATRRLSPSMPHATRTPCNLEACAVCSAFSSAAAFATTAFKCSAYSQAAE